MAYLPLLSNFIRPLQVIIWKARILSLLSSDSVVTRINQRPLSADSQLM
jgi:hypothetical protein